MVTEHALLYSGSAAAPTNSTATIPPPPPTTLPEHTHEPTTLKEYPPTFQGYPLYTATPEDHLWAQSHWPNAVYQFVTSPSFNGTRPPSSSMNEAVQQTKTRLAAYFVNSPKDNEAFLRHFLESVSSSYLFQILANANTSQS